MRAVGVMSEGAGAAAGLGPRLRSLRLERDLTLDALAEAASIDKGYLSRLERGLKAPSLATLIRLSTALDVPVSELFGESVAEHAVRVLRRAERRQSLAAGTATPRFEMLSRAGAVLEAFITYPGPDFAPLAEAAEHPGEELLLVLSGTIEARFADRAFVLETGDCAQFPGHLPHRLRTIGDQPGSALVVVAPMPTRRR